MSATNDFQHSMSRHDSHPLTKKVHLSVDKDSIRHKIGAALESRWADIFILCVVMADIGLLTVEHGIDSGLFCINGRRAPAADFQSWHAPPESAGELPAPYGPVHLPEGAAFVVPAGYDLALKPRREAMSEPPPPSGELPQDVGAPPGLPPLLQPAVLPPPSDTAAAAASRIAAAYPGRVAVQGGGGGESPFAQAPPMPATHLLQIASELGQLPGGGAQLLELDAETGADASRQRLRGRSHAWTRRSDSSPGGAAHGIEQVRICEPREGHLSHQIEHWAHILSVALLGLMLIEILVKLWVHPREFMTNPLEVLDLFIVSVSLFIDAILLPLMADPLTKAHAEIIVVLLLICRIWRVARILHGIVQVVMIQREHSHKLYERIKTLEKKEGELEALQKELARDQAPAPEKGRRRS